MKRHIANLARMVLVAILSLSVLPSEALADDWDYMYYNSAMGSLGFFLWQYDQTGSATTELAIREIAGLEDALSLGTDEYGYQWIDYVDPAGDGDATTLENLKGAIETMRLVNTYRDRYNKEYGLSAKVTEVKDAYGYSHYYAPPLKTNDYLMAVAELQLDWSANWMDHSANYGSPYSVAENLSFGYTRPFSGWYDEERATWLNAAKSGKNPDDEYVGHYLNVVDSSYDLTGFAKNDNSSYGTCYGEVFSWADEGDDAYDLSTYYSRFMTYYNDVKAHEFRDVTRKTAHFMDINWLAQVGISTGYIAKDGTRTYRGMTPVYRQDMAAFLYRLAGSPDYEPTEADMARFKDVSAKTPHCKEIWWLASEGISTGWKEKDGTYTFRGMDTVKRQDAAAFMHRLAINLGKGTQYTGTTNPFYDVNSKTAHYEDILWLADSGISVGYKEGNRKSFRGMTPVYRQDMAAFLHRLYDLE